MHNRFGRISTAVALVALALGVAGASSAQAASWHVEGKPFSGAFEIFSPQGNGTLDTNFAPAKVSVVLFCKAGTAGGSAVWGETHFRNILWIHDCKARSTITNEPMPECDQTNNGLNEVLLTLEGNGEAVASVGEANKIQFTKECVLGYKLQPSISLMTQDLSPPPYPDESFEHVVKGSGSGSMGVYRSMTVTYSSVISPTTIQYRNWGWY